jgi:hypothetical protein
MEMKERIAKLACVLSCVLAWTVAGVAYYMCDASPADVAHRSEYNAARRREVEAFMAARAKMEAKAGAGEAGN